MSGHPTLKILGNFGLFLCVALSVHGVTIKFHQATYSVFEGDLSGFTSVYVVVCIDDAATVTTDIKAYISTYNSTAKSGSDFIAITNQLVTIPQDQICTSHAISIVSDSIPEGSEQFAVQLSPFDSSDQVPSQFGTAVVTITDDDNPTGVVISFASRDYPITEGNQGSQTTVNVSICHDPSAVPTTAYISTVNGTAISGSDFTGISIGIVAIPQGQQCVSHPISIASDMTPEGSEQFTVQLLSFGLSVQVSSESGTATVIINDDDDIPTGVEISFNPLTYTVTEGDVTDGTVVEVMICHSPATTQTLGYISTVNGTAVSGSDFSGITYSLVTIPQGQECVSHNISIVSDMTPEGSEQFTVQLFSFSPSVQVSPGSGTATVTINDDDDDETPTGVTISFDPLNYTVTEGDVSNGTVVQVMICHTPTTTQTFGFISTADGTAVSGSDFTGITDSLVTIPEGQQCVSHPISIVSDMTPEGSEQFTVLLTPISPSGQVSLGSGTATITIKDDDNDETPTVLKIGHRFQRSMERVNASTDITPAKSDTDFTSLVMYITEIVTAEVPTTAPASSEIVTMEVPTTAPTSSDSSEINATQVSSSTPTPSEINTTSLPDTTSETGTTPVPSTTQSTTPVATCENNRSVCGENASCTDTPVGISCSCLEGFYSVGSDSQNCTACDRSSEVDHKFGFNCSQPCTCATNASCAADTGYCTGLCSEESAFVCDKNQLEVNLTPTPQSGEVEEGKELRLECSVNLKAVDVTLSWTGPSGNIEMDEKYNITKNPDGTRHHVQRLTVSQVDTSYSGMYTCNATLNEPTEDVIYDLKTVIITVLVQGKIVSHLPARKEGATGSNLTLACEAFGNPIPSVQWLFMNESAGSFANVDESLFEDDTTKRATANLNFYNLSKTNGGIYTCQVKVMSSIVSDSKEVTLVVVDLPEIGNIGITSTTSTSIVTNWTIIDRGADTRINCRANYTSSGSSEFMVEKCTYESNCTLNNLNAYTVYSITVECNNTAGSSNPLLTSGMTDSSAPSAPRNPSADNDDSGICHVQWEPSLYANGPNLVYKVKQKIIHSSTGEADGNFQTVEPSTKEEQYNSPTENMKLNSNYVFMICPRNDHHEGDCVNASGSCMTNSGAPDEIPSIDKPNRDTAVNSSSVILSLPDVDDRNGPISCYEFIVVKRTGQEGSEPPSDNVPFEKVKSASENDQPYRSVVMNHTEYVSAGTVTIGSVSSTVTRCTLMSSSIRRKRRSEDKVVNGQTLQATNSPLESSTDYDIFLRTYSETSGGMFQYTSSDYVRVTTTGGDSNPGLIVLLVLLIIIIIIAVAIFVVWKRRNNIDKHDTEILSLGPTANGGSKTAGGIDNQGFGGIDGPLDGKNRAFDDDDIISEVAPINIDQLGDSILEKHKHGDKLFSLEFKSLIPTNPDATIEACNNVGNKDKNRYINIPCYDHSRVELNQIEGVENSDYINANYIDGYSDPAKFIAAQGPKDETVEDFWRMIWEQNTKTVIMLTRCFESGRDKCVQYWPDSGEITFGKFTVCLDNTLECPDYVIRHFRLSKEGDEEQEEEDNKRIVTQFHFLAWPDHGVPEYPYAMLAFIKRIRQMTPTKPEKGQIVIHCSAGVGRTGTYITIDAMLDRLKEEKTVDIFNYIQKIRLQRSTLVQSQVQYVFIYHALHEEYLYGHTENRLAELHQYFRRLKLKNVQDDNSPLQNEFKTAATLPVKDISTKEASKSGNKDKNRIRNYLPYDKNRVNLERLVGDEDSTYINATYINGYERRNMYIITQAPMENTASDFWRMVWDSLTSTVVMLTDLEEKGNEMCVKFWPEEEPKTYGSLTIEMGSEEEEESFTVKDFVMSNNQGVSGRKIRMFQFHGWPEVGVPDCEALTHLVMISHEHQKAAEEEESVDQSKHPIIVFCHTGVGRTAIFCALSILIERAKAEGVVDVFQTVRTLRQQRQHMVQDPTQYEFLYKAVLSHLGKLDDTYENVQNS